MTKDEKGEGKEEEECEKKNCNVDWHTFSQPVKFVFRYE